MATSLLVLVAAAVCSLVHGHDVKYVITAPKVIRPGLPFTFSVSLTQNMDTTLVQATLSDQRDRSVLVTSSVTLDRGETQIITMMIPENVEGSTYDLIVTDEGDIFEHRVTVTVKDRSSIVLIQTDKAVYKSGDEVKYRVVSLDPDLKPKMMPMEVIISDPQQNKIILDDVEVDQLMQGVHSGVLQLSKFPLKGKWTIKVSAGNIEQEKKFQVEEYVLPKYEVSLDVPKYYFYSDTTFTITVTAKYTYGKPVNGSATVTYGMAPNVKKVTGELLDGSYTVDVSREEMLRMWCIISWNCESGASNLVNNLYQTSMTVDAAVTETLTEKVFSESAECTLTKMDLKGTFTGPDTFKSELPYSGMIELTGPDGGAPRTMLDTQGNLLDELRVNGLNITLTYTPTSTDANAKRPESTTETLTVAFDRSGRMPFVIDIAEKFERINIGCNFNWNWNQVSFSKEVEEFATRDEQSIQVSIPGLTGKVKGESVDVEVKCTLPITELYVMVLSKGKVVTTERMTFAATQLHTFLYPIQKSVLAPSANMIVYTFTSSGEILPDRVQFEVDGLFSNEVSVSFDKSSASPGDDIVLSIGASAGSFVAVLAVDRSVQLLGSGNDITEEEVMSEVERFDSTSNDRCPGCIDRRRKRRSMMWWPGMWGGAADATALFKDAGVYVITDAYVHKKEDYQNRLPGRVGDGFEDLYAMEEMAPDDGMDSGNEIDQVSPESSSRVRTEFPETWLWTEATLRSDGSTSITTKVPDTLTTWTASAFACHQDDGFGLSEDPATVQVFKDFFVSLNLPYSIVRGEKAKLQILVFNYKSTTLEVSLTLEESVGFTVRGEPVGDFTKTISVPSNDAVSVTPWIVPLKLGKIKLHVRVQASNSVDAVERYLLVEPECLLETYSKAQLINFGDSDTTTLDFSAEFPDAVVEGSQYVTLSLAGDLMGPSISGLDHLIRMPSGCGEQNMITFVPNIYALNYLNAVNQDTPKLRSDAIRYMGEGYQRELTYRRIDNSFSAFGNSDDAGSTWLTAFVAKSFRQAADYIYVDEQILRKSLDWIQTNFDAKSGTYREPGRVIHADMQGGTGKGIGLTAYCVLAFLENPDLAGAYRRSTDAALDYLEVELTDLEDPLAIALITYVLHLAERPSKTSAYEKLWSMRTEKDGHVFWQKAADATTDADAAADIPMPFWRRHTSSTSSSIEMTSYALLTMAYRFTTNIITDVTVGLPTMKYLASQRNEAGGFHSTQDTVMALRALSEYAALLNSDDQDITVTVSAGSQTHTFDRITQDNAILQQTLEISMENAAEIAVTCSGQGSGLLQLNVRYHVCDSPQQPGVSVNVYSTADNDTKVVSTNLCAMWSKELLGPSGMFVVELSQLSSYEVMDAPALLQRYQDKGLKRVETLQNRLVLYLDELPEKEVCFMVDSEPTNEVEELQKAGWSMYSYYNPQIRSEGLYLPDGLKSSVVDRPNPSLGNRAVVSVATLVMTALLTIATLI